MRCASFGDMDFAKLVGQWALKHPWLVSAGMVILLGALWRGFRLLADSRHRARARSVRIVPEGKRRHWLSTVYNPVQFRRKK